MSRRRVIVAVVVLLVGACGLALARRRPVDFPDPVVPDRNAFGSRPATGESLVALRRAAAYSASTGGLSVLVLRGQDVIFEEYQNGNRPDRPRHVFSGTKSFSGLMAQAAVADGILNLDEPVARTLPAFAADPLKGRITVRQLLDFTSGLRIRSLPLTVDGLFTRPWVRDKYAYACDQGCTTIPGSRYAYGSTHLMVFGQVMRQKLGKDPVAWLQTRILDDIGFRSGGWVRDPAGNPALPYGCWTTAWEWAKFGCLVRDDGVWKSRRLLPEGALGSCLSGSTAMPAYGLTFWLNRPVPSNLRRDLIPGLREAAAKGAVMLPGGPSDLVAAAGHKGNRCYVLPSKDLVVVRLGSSQDFLDGPFLSEVVAAVPDQARSEVRRR